MGTGYTRQSAAEIAPGNVITAVDLEDEFDAIQAAFHATTGHSHDATAGEGPLIALTTSITGMLPIANGGIAGIHKLNATVAPTANDDSSDNYAVGSWWINTTSDIAYVCVDATVAAAIWQRIQVYDAELAALAGLTSAADKVPYFTGVGTAATADFTSYGRSIVAVASEAALKALINAEAGVDFQAFDTELAALAGLTSAADKVPYFTGAGTAATADFTSYGRSIVATVSEATFKALVNLEIGVDVQAYDAGLADIAALAVTDSNIIVGNGTNWVAETGATARTSLGLGSGDSPTFTAVTTTTSTTTTANITTIELGHASDTTLSRVGTGGDIAVEGNTLYRVGGTDVAMADGGTGATLTDPGGDRILFWDDSAGAMTWLTASTGLTITTTSMTVDTASETVAGRVELATTTEAETGTDTTRAVTPAGLLAAASGQETIWLPANAFIANVTAGAAAGALETTTNDVMASYFAFDTTTSESIQCSIQMPKSWDEGTLIAQFVWTHPSTTVNFGVTWGIAAVAFANDDALDTAFGTIVEVDDIGGTTNDVYISDETTAITVAGTPAAEEFVVFKVLRDTADTGDTMAVDAYLLGVKIHYTTNAFTDD